MPQSHVSLINTGNIHTVSRMKPRSKDLSEDMNAGKNGFHIVYTQRSIYCKVKK